MAEAEGQAKALQITGEALRNNPQTLELEAVKKWDGKLPVYNGSGAVPFLSKSVQ